MNLDNIIAPRTADGEFFKVGMTVYFVDAVGSWGIPESNNDLPEFEE